MHQLPPKLVLSAPQLHCLLHLGLQLLGILVKEHPLHCPFVRDIKARHHDLVKVAAGEELEQNQACAPAIKG